MTTPISCRNAKDLERFAKRHRQVFGTAQDLPLLKAPCDSTFLYLFDRTALKALLSRLELDGVLIQADALHASPSFFSSPPSRAPTRS